MTLSVPELPADVDVLTAALAYAEGGWFMGPCLIGGHPGTVLGAGWQHQTSNVPADIRGWFRPGHGYGLFLHPGKSGAVVLDIDRPELVKPELADAIRSAGPPFHASRPGGDLAVSIPQGHAVFLMPPGRLISNSSSGFDQPGLDIRGANGGVYVFPSPHRKPEGRYHWMHTGPVPAAPEYIASRLLDVGQKSASKPRQPAAPIDPAAQARAYEQWTGNARPDLVGTVLGIWESKMANGASRNPSMFSLLMMAAEESAAGLYPWQRIEVELCRRYVDAMADPALGSGREIGSDSALFEFDSMSQRALMNAENSDPDVIRARVPAPITGPSLLTLAPDGPAPSAAVTASRRVPLGPFLDGTYTAPEPSIGAARLDDVRMLYPGRWHTVIGLNTAGKSWLGLWHAVAELRAGNVVTYLHFEESNPAGTISRLRLLGVPDDVIAERFVWLDCSRRWSMPELTAELEAAPPSLVVLDGINAACNRHQWPVNDTAAVGAYRDTLVAPATSLGAAVLSLGHPPKGRDRQQERHGFGSTAWLDEVDGVGFRVEADRRTPIRKGKLGHSVLYEVKDRYGAVEEQCQVSTRHPDGGWYLAGSFTVDSRPPLEFMAEPQPAVRVWLTAPTTSADAERDELDVLCDAIAKALGARGGSYRSQRDLVATLRAGSVVFTDKEVPAALQRMEDQGALTRPPPARGRDRPGCLATVPDAEAPTGEVDH